MFRPQQGNIKASGHLCLSVYIIVSSNCKEWESCRAWFQLLFFSHQAEDLLRREKNLEEAKKVVIKNDPSLPEPKCVRSRALDIWPVFDLVLTETGSGSAV